MTNKHFPIDQPKHEPKVEEAIIALRRLERESRNMNLGIEHLLAIQNEMVQHGWFLSEVESNYLRSWKLAESERKARYSELFVLEKKGKTDALAKESTNLLIKNEYFQEIHAEWKFKSIRRVGEIAKDSRDAIKDRIKSARDEKNESRGQP